MINSLIDFLNQSLSNPAELFVLLFWGVSAAYFIKELLSSFVIVSSKTTRIVERFGEYHKTLNNGFHVLIPFVDKIAYSHDLKLKTILVPSQDCFTSDEVNVNVDGVIYVTIKDAVKASYGINDLESAVVTLAQTAMRSVVGKLSLDQTFESREIISVNITDILNNAGAPWGIVVERYEVKSITPPLSVNEAMELKMEAERTCKTLIANSLATKGKLEKNSEAKSSEMINLSQGEKESMINRAEGKAAEILSVAKATADGIVRTANVIHTEGGKKAFDMKLNELFIKNIGSIKSESDIIVPASILDYNSWMKSIKVK